MQVDKQKWSELIQFGVWQTALINLSFVQFISYWYQDSLSWSQKSVSYFVFDVVGSPYFWECLKRSKYLSVKAILLWMNIK